MSLHLHWHITRKDLVDMVGAGNDIYNAWESIVERHPNSKVILRCAKCAGSLSLLIGNLESQFKNGQPSISCTCPNCRQQIDQYSMHYDRLAIQ